MMLFTVWIVPRNRKLKALNYFSGIGRENWESSFLHAWKTTLGRIREFGSLIQNYWVSK